MTTSDSVIESFPPEQSRALAQVLGHLRALMPSATEDLSWGMPTFRVEGIVVVSVLGFAHHNSVFPGPGVQEILGSALDGYATTKGTIHFDRNTAPPRSFLKRIIEAKMVVINRGFPKKSGAFLELYKNGVTKARGSYRAGEMHGAWSFFRQDGTMMRSGSFTDGTRVGTWTTYDRTGALYKKTQVGR